MIVFMDTLKAVSEESRGNQLKQVLKSIKYYICRDCTQVYMYHEHIHVCMQGRDRDRKRQGARNFSVTIV